MNQTKYIYVIPRWGGNSECDWYPWLKDQLESVCADDQCTYEVKLLDMPDWDLPNIQTATAYLKQTLPLEQLADTYLVGHSVGCLAVLHYLAEIGRDLPEAKLGGVLCVAGWFSIDNPWQDILNWIHAPIKYDVAKRLIPEDKLIVLLSDDDPYTSGFQENRQLWLERMHARVNILPGRQHFSEQLDTDVRDAVRDLTGAFDTVPLYKLSWL